jgi:hypothetical protein
MSSGMPLSSLAALAALGSLVACAGGPVHGVGVTDVRASSVQFIGPYEVAATAASSAEDLLRRRRPHLLLARAPHGQPNVEGTPLVYVDDVRQGGIGMLGMVPAQRIIDVRYLTWMEAEARYPGRHPAGVILVRTKRSTPP